MASKPTNAEPDDTPLTHGNTSVGIWSDFNRSKPICQPLNWDKPKIITTASELEAVLKAIKATDAYHALDFETTSLKPIDGKVRISSIYGPAGYFVIDHFLASPFAGTAQKIAAASEYFVFNVGFEGRWFDAHSEGVRLMDVQLMRKSKMGGGFIMTLKQMVAADLKIELDKEEQASNWAAPVLTEAQYAYAGYDAKVTYELAVKWIKEMSDENWTGACILNDSWRGTCEAEDTGLLLDEDYHRTLIKRWTLRKEVAERYLRIYAFPDDLENLNSKQQIGKWLQTNALDDTAYRAWPKTGKTNSMDLTRNTLRMASYNAPYPISRWLAALMIYNKSVKYLSTYGDTLLTVQGRRGAVTARFNIAAAITGRYSSSSVNLQNIPRSTIVRRSFVANLLGTASTLPAHGDDYRLVMADYSSIEVRVLAAISGDKDLMHEAIYGDVHAVSAAARMKIPADEFKAVLKDKTDPRRAMFKEARSRAKAITFAVCYGAGVASLAVSLRCTMEQAQESMEQWAKRYPRAYHYRTLMFEKMMQTGFLQVADGRSIYVHKTDRTLPVAANYGIQGAAASVMYRAMFHTHRLLCEGNFAARIAFTCHDEIGIRSRVEDADQVAMVLEEAMRLGWLDIFPDTSTEHLADAAIGMSWADKA